MTALLTAISTKRHSRRLQPESAVYLRPLVERMGQMRPRGRGKVFAITAVSKGSGASHVTRLVAQELARTYRTETVILTLDELLRLPYPPRVGDADLFHEWTPRTSSVIESSLLRHPCPAGRVGIRIAELRDWGGGFALIDCPALEEGAATFAAASHTDGAVLTVAAGENECNEVHSAARAFEIADTPLLGMVLNKRTYAIPQAVYRWL